MEVREREGTGPRGGGGGGSLGTAALSPTNSGGSSAGSGEWAGPRPRPRPEHSGGLGRKAVASGGSWPRNVPCRRAWEGRASGLGWGWGRGFGGAESAASGLEREGRGAAGAEPGTLQEPDAGEVLLARPRVFRSPQLPLSFGRPVSGQP